jgi:predicted alpha/beta-fold hydrolase
MREYTPPRWLRGRHRMTFYAWAKRRTYPSLPPAEARYFTVSPVTTLLAHCHWQPERQTCPTLIVLHGLEGSSEAHYMKGLAAKAWQRGFNIVRLNQRNCGGTDHLSEGLYHSALWQDPAAVLRELVERDGASAIALVGYSLGGNLMLRLAGAYGAAPPPELKAVCAVSPTLDLAACMDLLERPSNRVYEWYFMAALRKRMRNKARLFPRIYDASGLRGLWSLRRFDDRYTAPHSGYRDAADYYHRAAAMRVIDQIHVPTLLVTSEDDPFIAVEPFRHPLVKNNPALSVIITRYGGHCGFVEAPAGDYDGYWAEDTAIAFVSSHLSRV